MSIAQIIERVSLAIMHGGMPLVQCYHLVCNNLFLNTAVEETSALEKVADGVLAPVHYLFGGTIAVEVDPKEHFYYLKQRFDYTHHFALKATASVIALPVSLVMGSVLKGIACMSEDTRVRHRAIKASFHSTRVDSNNDYYRSIGIEVEDFESAPLIGPPAHMRRPGAENYLALEKQALKDVIQILTEQNILHWVDCGTCLGAYRYGGIIPWDNDVDIAILAPDFQNVKHALNGLDKSKYAVQDWSGREVPGTYLKVYVKETGTLIDIYHFSIDAEKKTVTSILSNEGSIFLPTYWKVRERRYVIPTPFGDVFPLKRAEFDGITVLVPNQTIKYLQGRYGENIEPVRIYDEKTGQYEKDPSHPYWNLSYVH